MSATNTTDNYNLPVFVGTDKPAWLVDFNGAMTAIDTQMKANADAAAAAAGDVARALLKPLSPPALAELVGVNTAGNQMNLTIGEGLAFGDGVLKAIDLNLSDTASYNTFVLPTGVSYQAGYVYKALNSAKTIGKIYGNLAFNNAGSVLRAEIPTGIVVKPTGADYTISVAGFSISSEGSVSAANILVSSSGAVSIDATVFPNTRTTIYLFPCLYFFEDFGDQP